ncbi:MAG: hypothetical protein ACI4U3_10420 [Traorella sp.]
MKKIVYWILAFMLVACQNKNENLLVQPQNVGQMCTLVTDFSDDIYNISLFYTEEYPILNKDDFNYISQLALKYSTQGMKDASKYQINVEKAHYLCEMENPEVIAFAIEIPKTNILKFKSELERHQFYYEIEQDGETYDIEVENEVISATKMEINMNKIKSLTFSDEEVDKLKTISFDEALRVYEDENHHVDINMEVSEKIQADGSQTNNQDNLLASVGEAYQYFLTVADSKEISVSYIKIATLIKLSKEEINELSYLDINGGVMLTDLEEYKLFENDSIVMYDLNPYLYHYTSITDYIASYSQDDWNLDDEQINQLRNQYIEQLKQLY